MITVVIESPFAGDTEKNKAYLRRCMADSLARGEAPFASHGLYTQDGVLDDSVPEERLKGIDAGLAIAKRLDMTAVYADLGISSGMRTGIASAHAAGRPVDCRFIGK